MHKENLYYDSCNGYEYNQRIIETILISRGKDLEELRSEVTALKKQINLTREY